MAIIIPSKNIYEINNPKIRDNVIDNVSIDNTIVKVILIITLFVSIFAIGFSRIYLGVHYFSDVLGGFLLSISYLMLFININKFNLSEVKQWK